MSDIIQLLPDSVANQIAAGEVVQRPASAVKELIENSIDAGASTIRLVVKDAGKSLIQLIDDGCGMSLTDARMCFERHATSKIRKAGDLFSIRTMGFRGEAMASIAAIAQVELKTRRHEDELGTSVIIEGSEIVNHEPVMCPAGTSTCVKNLFYNTPGRRNFLKSNPVELRHIIDEFQRVALAHPEIHFTFHSDGSEVFHLPKSTLKQRIVHVFGNSYNQKLVPLQEETSIISVSGYIGKPEFAKKTRGEQFFFVNKRFIKDPYLNNAILNAYRELLPADSYPLYVLFIEIDPSHIDINVHPTKTEIKYQDDKAIYAIIRSSVKRSLGQYNITPTIDFDQETGFNGMITPIKEEDIVPPQISFNPSFNPFSNNSSSGSAEAYVPGGSYKQRSQRWDSLYEILEGQREEPRQAELSISVEDNDERVSASDGQFFQLHNRLILSPIKSGIMLIDQQAAHERILYERFLEQLETHQGLSQQSLFPQTVTLPPSDFELVKELMSDITALGFQIREFGKNTFIIEGIPAEISLNVNEIGMLEQLIEGFKYDFSELKLQKRDALARSMARNSAIKAGSSLSQEEMNSLIDELFACQKPNLSLSGKPVIVKYSIETLLQKFEK